MPSFSSSISEVAARPITTSALRVGLLGQQLGGDDAGGIAHPEDVDVRVGLLERRLVGLELVGLEGGVDREVGGMGGRGRGEQAQRGREAGAERGGASCAIRIHDRYLPRAWPARHAAHPSAARASEHHMVTGWRQRPARRGRPRGGAAAEVGAGHRAVPAVGRRGLAGIVEPLGEGLAQDGPGGGGAGPGDGVAAECPGIAPPVGGSAGHDADGSTIAQHRGQLAAHLRGQIRRPARRSARRRGCRRQSPSARRGRTAGRATGSSARSPGGA